MSHRESCQICNQAGFILWGEDDYRACICLTRDRVRAAIDSYPDLAGAKPVAVPSIGEELRSLRLHGSWDALRGHLAYAIGRTRITEGRRLDLWIVPSGQLRAAHMKCKLPELTEGQDLIVVRLRTAVNRLMATALVEVLSSTSAPVWIVTHPPERPLEDGHPAWTPEAGPLFGTIEAIDLSGKPRKPKRNPLALIGLEKEGDQ